VLGVVRAPAAAVLAFVDPGLAKDENCAALLGNAEAGENAPLKGKTPAPPDNTAPPAH
jgi:AsmA family protein